MYKIWVQGFTKEEKAEAYLRMTGRHICTRALSEAVGYFSNGLYCSSRTSFLRYSEYQEITLDQLRELFPKEFPSNGYIDITDLKWSEIVQIHEVLQKHCTFKPTWNAGIPEKCTKLKWHPNVYYYGNTPDEPHITWEEFKANWIS